MVTSRNMPVLAKLVLGGSAIVLIVIALLSGCGQKNPTQPLTGLIFVSSSISGATIFLDGADTHQATPDTLKDVPIGSHTVSLHLEGYVTSPQEVTVSSGLMEEVVFVLSRARVVLLEHFTWVFCAPCPSVNRIINELLETLGPEKVVGIEYHPFDTLDPFYAAASFENITRKNYYGVSTVPTVFVDGAVIPQVGDTMSLPADLEDAIENRLAQPPPAIITVTDTVTGTYWSARAQIIGLENVVSSDLRGFFFILEKEIHLSQPPGSNGEKDFYFVMRKILPQPFGEVLNVAAGDTLTKFQEFDLQPDWDPAQIHTVYFLQDYITKEVLAVGSSM